MTEEAPPDEDTQAKRQADFEAQVRAQFPPEVLEKMLAKLNLTPITAQEWRKCCESWMFSTCIPGRLLPQLLYGPKGKDHPEWIPLHGRIVMVKQGN